MASTSVAPPRFSRTRSSRHAGGGEPSSGDRPTKRSRQQDHDLPPRYFVTCLDRPFEELEVHLPSLREFGDCRMLHVITKDPPNAYTKPDGHPIWTMPQHTYAVMRVILRALCTGELTIDEGVSYSELVTALDFENIGPPNNLQRVARHLHSPPAASLAGGGYAQVTARLRAVAEEVADAILMWPTIGTCMSRVLNGQSAIPGMTHVGVSSTRVWISFRERPVLPKETHGRDVLFELARDRPQWLTSMLRIIAVFNCELHHSHTMDNHCNQEAFAAISEAMKEMQNTWYLGCASSVEELYTGRFADSVISRVMRGGPVVSERNKDMPMDVKFARALVGLSEKRMRKMQLLNLFFDGSCSDDSKSTPERKALAKAFQTRRVTVVRWANDQTDIDLNALDFPPWVGPRRGHTTPCVLLSFEKFA